MARSLEPDAGRGERAYLALLDRRLVALASVAAALPATLSDLGLSAEDLAIARRFLRSREAAWHDGDENLVRAHVEARGADSPARQARRLLDTADLLARIAPRIETVWCFLWLMEAALPPLVEPPHAPC